jgi:hypothetical protein
MTDADTDTGTDESDAIVKLRRSEIKVLQKKAKERDDFAEQLATAQGAVRELAFAKAGISLSDKRASYFVKGYDGDIEDVDAIRAAAQEIGLLAGEQQSEKQTEEQQQEKQAHTAIYSASQGSGAPLGAEDKAMEQAYGDGGGLALAQYLAAQGVPIADD